MAAQPQYLHVDHQCTKYLENLEADDCNVTATNYKT